MSIRVPPQRSHGTTGTHAPTTTAPTRATPESAAPQAPAPAPAAAPSTPRAPAAQDDVRAGATSRRAQLDLAAQTRAASVGRGDGPPASTPSLADVRAGSAALARGHHGTDVTAVQQHLVRAGYDTPTDGRLGPATERAVSRFQADRDLPATGAVDRATLSALESGSVSSAGARETDVNRAERVCAQTYERHGDESHALSDRHAVGELISRSPQVDGNRATTGDRSTCGGAALLNGMLLDGDYAANGRAIEDTATEMTRRTPPLSALTTDERGALASMRAGHLTPHETNTLQGLLARMTDHEHPGDATSGTDAVEMRDMVTDLRRHGGFPNTEEMTVRMERIPGPGDTFGHHYTVSSRTRDGAVASADSWPNQGGYASVTAGGSSGPRYRAGEALPADFEAEVTLRNPAGRDAMADIDMTTRTYAASGAEHLRLETNRTGLDESTVRAGEPLVRGRTVDVPR